MIRLRPTPWNGLKKAKLMACLLKAGRKFDLILDPFSPSLDEMGAAVSAVVGFASLGAEPVMVDASKAMIGRRFQLAIIFLCINNCGDNNLSVVPLLVA